MRTETGFGQLVAEGCQIVDLEGPVFGGDLGRDQCPVEPRDIGQVWQGSQPRIIIKEIGKVSAIESQPCVQRRMTVYIIPCQMREGIRSDHSQDGRVMSLEGRQQAEAMVIAINAQALRWGEVAATWIDQQHFLVVAAPVALSGIPQDAREQPL
ncbi:MAG TPA: hypothetical protein VM659_25340 [Dongiaceae bacterium]|nr:hypothetical protein [Dongiaceae bacterium]